MTIIHLPAALAIDKILLPGDKIACRNATVIEKADGSFSGWIDNTAMIAVVQSEDEDEP